MGRVRTQRYDNKAKLERAVRTLCESIYRQAYGKPWTDAERYRWTFGSTRAVNDGRAAVLIQEMCELAARVRQFSETMAGTEHLERGLFGEFLLGWHTKYGAMFLDLPDTSAVTYAEEKPDRAALMRSLCYAAQRLPKGAPARATVLAAISILCGFMPYIAPISAKSERPSAEDVVQKEAKYVRRYLGRGKPRGR